VIDVIDTGAGMSTVLLRGVGTLPDIAKSASINGLSRLN